MASVKTIPVRLHIQNPRLHPTIPWPKSNMEELGNLHRYPGQTCPNPNTNSNPRDDLEIKAAQKTPPHEGQVSKTGLLMLSHLAKGAHRSQKDPGGKMLRPKKEIHPEKA